MRRLCRVHFDDKLMTRVMHTVYVLYQFRFNFNPVNHYNIKTNIYSTNGYIVSSVLDPPCMASSSMIQIQRCFNQAPFLKNSDACSPFDEALLRWSQWIKHANKNQNQHVAGRSKQHNYSATASKKKYRALLRNVFVCCLSLSIHWMWHEELFQQKLI